MCVDGEILSGYGEVMSKGYAIIRTARGYKRIEKEKATKEWLAKMHDSAKDNFVIGETADGQVAEANLERLKEYAGL